MTALKTVVCFGDSQTDSDAGYGVHGFETWPAVLQESLKAAGVNARCRSFGVSGDTSAQMLARVQDAFVYGRPDCAVLYIGVNDSSGTQANIQAAIKALKHRAIGDEYGSGPTVAGQASLPATGRLGQRYVVLSDTSSTGGMAAVDPRHHATITGAGGSAQTVWEYRYSAAGELGWGRVATAATAPLTDVDGAPLGVKYIVVVSTNYLNFTAGGDTPSTPYAANATIRTAQQAAVTAETGNGTTVTYADLYAAQKALITGSSVPDFSAVAYDQTKSWHYKQDNQHHNAFGHSLVAATVRGAAALTAAIA